MSKDAQQAKRNQRAKAAKANAKAKQKLSAEELAKVSGGQDWRAGGGAWRVGQPYIEDYSTGWVSGSARDKHRGGAGG